MFHLVGEVRCDGRSDVDRKEEGKCRFQRILYLLSDSDEVEKGSVILYEDNSR